MFSPIRRPVCTRTSAVLPPRTTRTFSTPANTISELVGTVMMGWAASVTISARAKAPARSSPRSFGISASTVRVRLSS